MTISDSEIFLYEEVAIKGRVFIIMNKLAHIDTTIPVMNMLARLALCERLQDTFNLHPGKMAQKVVRAGKKQGVPPSTIATGARERASALFEQRFTQIRAIIENEEIRIESDEMDTYFNLYPRELAKGLQEKVDIIMAGIEVFPEFAGAKERKEDTRQAILLVSCIALHQTTCKLLGWAFDEVDRLIRDGKVK